jgi:hypothetical protein
VGAGHRATLVSDSEYVQNADAVLAGFEDLAPQPLHAILTGFRARREERERRFLTELVHLLQVNVADLQTRMEASEQDAELVERADDVYTRVTDPEIARLVVDVVALALGGAPDAAPLQMYLLLDVFAGLTSAHFDLLETVVERRAHLPVDRQGVGVSSGDLESALTVESAAVLLIVQGLVVRGLVIEDSSGWDGGVFYRPTPPGETLICSSPGDAATPDHRVTLWRPVVVERRHSAGDTGSWPCPTEIPQDTLKSCESRCSSRRSEMSSVST